MVHRCYYCDKKYIIKQKLFLHIESIHQHEPFFKINCDLQNCKKSFKSVRTYEWHLRKCHQNITQTSSQPDVKCFHCTYQANNLSNLISHLRYHFKCHQAVQCPVAGCNKIYSVFSSLTSHLSRVHGRIGLRFLNKDKQFSGCKDAQLPEDTEQLTEDNLSPDNTNDYLETESDTTLFHQENIKQKFGLFLLKLCSKYILPESAIQEVVDSTLSVEHLQLVLIENKLNEIFSKHNVDISITLKDDLQDFFETQNKLFSVDFKTSYKRSLFFKSKFGYVEPREIYLGLNMKRVNRSFQYVPLLENLQRLLQHKDVLEQVYSIRPHQSGYYADFSDGLNYQNNTLFHSFSDSQPRLSLIFYFDEFEIANPIGSHRKIHKMAAFYYILGNLKPSSRSSLHVIQLSILCRSSDLKEFGLHKILKPLITDLNILSNEGVMIPGKGFLQGGIAFICADNLGSNFLGAFSESFSPNVMYICRTCMINKDNIQSEFCPSKFSLRNVEDYDKYISESHSNRKSFSDCGIKYRSPLMDIPNFHVLTGLPPDAMHDVLEGMVPYELETVLNKLISKKYFTLKFLNQRILHFQYGKSDIVNKPVEQTLRDGVIGTAAENWCLLRMLPFLIGCQVPENNPYWEFLMHLKFIVELIFAPYFTLGYVSLLQSELVDHLERFKELFPDKNIKPKQHFILHYPQHILNFGPPIRYSCFRLEGKHSYFKQIIRHTKQFKNPPLTLAHRHQLMQTYYSSSLKRFLKEDIDISGGIKFNADVLSEKIKKAILNEVTETDNIVQVSKATVKGTVYEVKQFLPITFLKGDIVFGEILFMLFVNSKLWFVLKKYSSEPLLHFGSLQVNDMNEYVCIEHNKLIDYYPLNLYIIPMHGKKINLLSLKHYLCELDDSYNS